MKIFFPLLHAEYAQESSFTPVMLEEASVSYSAESEYSLINELFEKWWEAPFFPLPVAGRGGSWWVTWGPATLEGGGGGRQLGFPSCGLSPQREI